MRNRSVSEMVDHTFGHDPEEMEESEAEGEVSEDQYETQCDLQEDRTSDEEDPNVTDDDREV